MLALSLRLAWFVLSLTGLLSCYFTLYVMAFLVGSTFLPVMYAVSMTILQMPFLIGLHWDYANAYALPKAFCQAQIILLNIGASMTTGVVVCFTQATATTVLGRAKKGSSPTNSLSYRHSFLIWTILLPACFAAVFIALALHFDAITPNGMSCDANKPEWIRFFGYAGNVVIAIPCFIISCVVAHRLIRSHLRRQAEFKAESAARSNASGPPRATPHYQLKRTRNTNSLTSPLSSPVLVGDRDSLSFAPTTPTSYVSQSQKASFQNSPMVFKKPVISISETNSDYEMLKTPASYNDSLPHPATPNYTARRPVPAYAPTISEAQHEQAEEDTDQEFYSAKAASVLGPAAEVHTIGRNHGSQVMSQTRSGLGEDSGFVLPPNLIPAIWRMGLFQIAFFGIEILATLTTIIDLAQHRDPVSEFGTQHVAILLAAWGPLIVFGHLPSFRAYLFTR